MSGLTFDNQVYHQFVRELEEIKFILTKRLGIMGTVQMKDLADDKEYSIRLVKDNKIKPIFHGATKSEIYTWLFDFCNAARCNPQDLSKLTLTISQEGT